MSQATTQAAGQATADAVLCATLTKVTTATASAMLYRRDFLVMDCGGNQSGATTGDILADDDGAVAIPAALAQEIADVCSEQEHKEELIRGLVQQGVPVSECYPPNAATLEQYEAWK